VRDTEGKPQFEQLTGRKSGNRLLGPVLEMHTKDLSFDPQTQIASEYRPWRLGGSTILMHPDRRFGEPIVEASGYTARTLYDAYRIEGSVDAAARVYGVSTEEIELACSFYDYLLGPSLRDESREGSF
jgi:uncharacterized protein (DUF433 family)